MMGSTATAWRSLLVLAIWLGLAWCQLTQTEINQILAIHNAYRAEVCVAPITWDNTVATVAQVKIDRFVHSIVQNYANKCVWGHNTNR